MKPEELRTARKRLGFTQIQLAKKLGLSAQTIRNYEAGRTTVPKHVGIAVYALLCDLDGRF